MGMASSSIAARRKPIELASVSIEAPRRNENFKDESVCDSPAGQSRFKSPMNIEISRKIIAERGKREREREREREAIC